MRQASAPEGMEPSNESFEDCPHCGWGINDEILAETPDCPHGWSTFEGMTVADIKAEFAAGEIDNLSIDPAQ